MPLVLANNVTVNVEVSIRIEFKLCLLVHKVQLGRSPRYISDLSTLAADVPGRPVIKPRWLHCICTTYKSHFLLLLPERAWNRLPMELRQLRSTPLFNRKLKTFLFTAELQNWTANWTDYIMRPRSAVNVGGALEILFVLYWLDATHVAKTKTPCTAEL